MSSGRRSQSICPEKSSKNVEQESIQIGRSGRRNESQRISSNSSTPSRSSSALSNSSEGDETSHNSYAYDFNVFEPSPSEKKTQPHKDLTWRADPKESFSDWTIAVSCESLEGVDTYHVHKTTLGAGKYRCEHFRALFRSTGENAETVNSTSSFRLEESAAGAFPKMLDHVYNGSCKMNTQSAVALVWLSRRFGVRTLFDEAAEFIRMNMDETDAHVYLSEATLYGDHKIQVAARRLCAEHFSSLSKGQVQSLAPELLTLVLNYENLVVESEVLSQVIADYCRARALDVEGKFLAGITDHKFMPKIHPSEALFLLNLCIHHESDKHRNGDESSSLQSRCIDATKDWKAVFGNSVPPGDRRKRPRRDGGCFDGCSSLSLPLRSELMESALVSASIHDAVTVKENAVLQKELDRLSKKCSTSDSKLVQCQRQLTSSNQRNSNFQTELSLMKKEMSKFHRVPQGYTQICTTYPSQCGEKSTTYGYGACTTCTASKMPNIDGTNLSVKSGMLYPSDLTGESYWPIYYYNGKA
eukprot:CAMPEP_0194312428 /NCGR_PEP_ID=MMETSP0171-20130528/9349_1 /TAXON_ID=218684 /ORGANISM="Corethron pennatum, Strain L29A3" /LENGTH=527 /DNA_ID=CAMNT_0039066933 /DNA_START=199 /DNA_END=1782 /DNA_ORIENTATION=-